MVRTTFVDLNNIELKYYSFMISLNKLSGICNVLSPKMCFLKEKKYINVKVFNMITSKKETKTMAKYISCDFNSTTYNSNQKWSNENVNVSVKIIVYTRRDYNWNPSTFIFLVQFSFVFISQIK